MFNHFSLRAARNSLMTVLVLSTRDELQHHRVQSEISLSEGKITRGRNLGWDTRLSRRPCQARETGAQELHTLPQEIMQLFFFLASPCFHYTTQSVMAHCYILLGLPCTITILIG